MERAVCISSLLYLLLMVRWSNHGRALGLPHTDAAKCFSQLVGRRGDFVLLEPVLEYRHLVDGMLQGC